MKLLLCKNLDKLGIVGDIVDVPAGYARNYLLPKRLATQPTQANVRRLAEARRQAELEMAQQRKLLESLAARLENAEVTIQAKANEDGALYGSVGARDIAAALYEEGFGVKPEHIQMSGPIRQLDNVTVTVRLADDLRCEVKVWVVREKGEGETEEGSEDSEAEAGMEAADDHRADT